MTENNEFPDTDPTETGASPAPVSKGAQAASDSVEVAKAAVKSGLVGGAAGAAKGAATVAIKTKTGRNVAAGALVMVLVIAAVVSSMILGMLTGLGGTNQDHAMQDNGMKKSGLKGSELSQMASAANNSGAPWPIITALYQIQQGQGVTAAAGAGAPGTGTGAAVDTSVPKTKGFSMGSGCQPWATKVGLFMHAHWGNNDNGAGTMYCQNTEPDSDHNSGNAIDYMFTPGAQDDLGRTVATWLMKNSAALQVKYLIFRQHIWNPSRDAYGVWRQMEDRGDPTQNHMDHIHMSFNHPNSAGNDAILTPGTPGTYDFGPTPVITTADIAAAFGGAGSGGAVSQPAGGGTSTVTTSETAGHGATPDNVFAIKDRIPGISKEDKKSVEKSGKFLGRWFMSSLGQQPGYSGEDMGTGLALTSDNKVIVTTTQQKRDLIEKSFIAALKELPVEGAGKDSDAWAKSIWDKAIALRMGQSADTSSCSSGVPASANQNAPAPTKVGTGTAPPGKTISVTTPNGGTEEVGAKQLKNIAIIVAVAKTLPMSEPDKQRAALLGVMTAAQETRWQRLANAKVPESLKYNPDAVDHSNDSGEHSVGIFQLQAGNYPDSSNDWGTVANAMDVEFSAKEFYGIKVPTPSGKMAPGLLQHPGWQALPNAEAIEKVQVSGHPEYYAGWEAASKVLIKAATGIDVTLGSTDGGTCTANATTGGTGAAGGAVGTGVGAKIVATAKQHLGVPYLWGGTDINVGVDCSGFTGYVYKQNGITLPRTAHEQQAFAKPTTTPQPGDLVFFGNPARHVGIYAGPGQMINAPHTGTVTRQEAIWSDVTGYGHVG